MRKGILIAALFSLFLPSFTFAGNIGGLSSSVGGQRLNFGLNIGYLLRDTEDGESREREISSRQLLLKVNYGILDFLDLYGELGVADLQIEDRDFESTLSTIYGGGVKFSLLPSTSDFKFLFDAQILAFSGEDGGIEADFLEYQGAAILCFQSNNFATYAGVKVSQVEVDCEPQGKLEAKKPVGIFLGIDYFVNPKVFFAGEMHNFDQDAVYLGVGYKL
ncbi:MAG: hypothetical protein JSU92_15060 [Deltaproteobacteria bacterium]|nr:MAG: hypothetical protein JSU92_15060 [Deltaproteobacteria bacterium]